MYVSSFNRWIYDKMSGEAKVGVAKRPRFHELMADCEILLPSPVFPARSPVLEARIQRLQAQQEEREYWGMVAGIDKATKMGGGSYGPGSVDEPISKQRKNKHSCLLPNHGHGLRFKLMNRYPDVGQLIMPRPWKETIEMHTQVYACGGMKSPDLYLK
jgi:hypothetical protein